MSNPDPQASPLPSFLAGIGRDGRGRTLEDVLAFSNADIERVHDFIQWLFPLPTRSAAQPGSPVLSPDDIAAIRSDSRSLANLDRASARMLSFYRETSGWLARDDHNHLRITRILHALRLLRGEEAARAFYDAVMALHAANGSPINPDNLRYWSEAVQARRPV
jgi:hypothetical protein